ncbi:hypothetical protein LTS10_012998 [Elasticomyces elasticus]|nr:hypothetical protein LTS10_012998 [Elasticomyces elasticus]
MVPVIPLLQRRETHFVLWRPAHVDPAPRIRIGTYASENRMQNPKEQDLVQSSDFPELWELAASDPELALEDGKVYHYWFLIKDSSPVTGGSGAAQTEPFVATDPFASTVDRRLKSGTLSAPYTEEDRDAAAVILFEGNKLKACDPGKEMPDWSKDGEMKDLPPNNRLVIYELPTRWVKAGSDKKVGIGTFQDVLALVGEDFKGANFRGLAALKGSYIKKLGINALELLPPQDSHEVKEWGYGTSNYLSADFDLGRPKGQTAPTASRDLAALVSVCHCAGIRFFLDVVMAFARHAPYENVNFLDFHVQKEAGREAFGGKLMKYNYPIRGYDPISGTTQDLIPARQWVKTVLTHWMQYYRVDGIRMDSVLNFSNWENLARDLWRQRWREKYGSVTQSCEARFLVVAEELSVPMGLLDQNKADSLWNDHFKYDVRDAILGGPGLTDDEFARRIKRMVDCRLEWGFADGPQSVNYITSHDVGNNFQSQRLYNFLHDVGLDPEQDQGRRIKLAFVCLLTAVGIPMILAGEEFADQHDLLLADPKDRNRKLKQIDPINFQRWSHPWRKRLFHYVARLIKFRTEAFALSMNETRFIHYDFTPGRRVIVWARGMPGGPDQVVVVSNFSAWGTSDPTSPTAEYRVNNWPELPHRRKWYEVTAARDVPTGWAGREPLYPWEAKVYAMMPQ